MTTSLKLGKQPATYSHKDFRFADHAAQLDLASIKQPPIFGHGNSFSDWGMLGNDEWGDCVFAGSDHEVMLLSNLAAGGKTGQEVVKFTAADTLSDYSAVTGFNPEDPNTDQGTEVRDALNYRRKTGVKDSSNQRHKIGLFVALEPGNIQQLLQATFIFEVVGIGIEFPESAMDQFNESKPWSVARGSQIEGGHYVPIVGRPSAGYLACVTWAKRQLLTEAFYKKYCDEAWAYITEEELNKRTSTNWGGFDWLTLTEALKGLAA